MPEDSARSTPMTNAEKAAFVADRTVWGRDLEPAEIAKAVGPMAEVSGKAGDFLFREGDVEDYMAFIVEGQFQVIKKNQYLRKKVVAEFNPGEILGEIALIDDKGRSAAAFAVTDYRLLVLRREDYLTLSQDDPRLGYKMLHSICRLLCDRLRQTTGVSVYANFTECAEILSRPQGPGRESFLRRLFRK